MMRTLTECLRAHAETRPDKVFWRQVSASGVAELTFAQFLARAAAFAAVLGARGVTPGGVVLVFLPQGPDAAAAFFGAMLAGAVPSFMPSPSPKQQPALYWPAHLHLLQRIGRHALVSDRATLAEMRAHGIGGAGTPVLAIEDVPDEVAPLPVERVGAEAVALLQHSSGTTALKKGVALSHRAILLQVHAYAERLAMGEADGIVSWLPLYHDMGLIACTVTPLVLGQTVTCIDPFHWVARPAALFDAIARHAGRFVWMPNFAFEHLVRGVPADCTADLSGVRAFIDCSEPCMPDTLDRFVARFAPLGVRPAQMQVCYAMAETVFAVSQTPAGEAARVIAVDADRLHRDGIAAPPSAGAASLRLLSAGPPLPWMDVRVMRDGRDLPDGTVGEVTLRGPMLFDGYFKDPKTTAARLVDGRHLTRDRGFVRDGELYVLGREDDLLIVNGRNLHAHEVESLLAAIPGLKPGRAVAFGVFSAEIGSEELVVAAERAAGADPALDDAAARAIRRAVFEATGIEVKTCRIVAEGWLVKTTSGKISRAANRAKFLDVAAPAAPASAAPLSPPPAGETLTALGAFIADWFRLPAEAIGAETVASDVAGWDSLAHSTMMLGVEQAFGVRFADNEIFGVRSVGELARRIDALLARGTPATASVERVAHRSAAASIVRLGSGDGPDIIVFAGRSKSFGGLDLMDFASVFAGTAAESATKYFVTDHKQDWYVTCFEEVAAQLNALSPGPKILFGNSMGGYAALRFATALRDVVAVLSLVPQSAPPRGALVGRSEPADFWKVRLAPGIRYCVMFGEAEDEGDKAHLRAQVTDGDTQRLILVRNCGHNLAPYLAQEKLLPRVLEAIVRPETMGDQIAGLVSTIRRSPRILQRRQAQLQAKRTVPAPGLAVEPRPAPRPVAKRPPRRKRAAAVAAEAGLLERNFARANVTGDGRLTFDQAKARLPRLAGNFHRIDVDAKGYITLDDIRAHRAALGQTPPPAPVAAPPSGKPGG